MFITKIAQNNPFETNISNERMFSLFSQKIEGGEVYWKESEPYRSPEGTVVYTYLGYILTGGAVEPDPNQAYSFNLSIAFDYIEKDTPSQVDIELFLNVNMSQSGSGEQRIASWSFTNDRSIESMFEPFVKTEFNIDIKMPHEIEAEKVRQEEIAERGSIVKKMFGKDVVEGIRLTRSKSPDHGDAKSLVVYVSPAKRSFDNIVAYTATYVVKNLEKGRASDDTVVHYGDLEKSLEAYDNLVARAKANNYVDEEHADLRNPYIPEDADSSNYDFLLKRPKGEVVEEAVEEDVGVEEPTGDIDIDDIFGSNEKAVKIAQDFDGYFAGDIPDYAVNNLGTGAVDASQVSSMFGKTDDAIRLVNEFDSSLLGNVSFIFNFSKSGAYGVYLSELDRVIKTEALERRLESEGYRVQPNEKGMLIAYPVSEEKTPEEIQQDIDRLYTDLEAKGGTAFGINMSSVLNASRMDAQASGSEDPNIWEWMALLHLGGTIVHEAIHAKGSHDEGPSDSAENAFTAWALPRVNEQYRQALESQGQGEMYAPLIVGTGTRSAEGKSWYKKAQMNYMPQSITGKPRGSDLSGRMGGYTPEEGMADWGMLAQQDQNVPLEKRLGRQFMSPLPPDLSQENDSYEEQLRKYTREDIKIDPNATMEELLSCDHDADNTAYKPMEELLEERRPKPLIIPLNKEASNKMVKKATLFGWMNNLEISDGNTIPGLSDRVMAWEDSEGDFAWTEKEIRSQPRYNPTYDVKGFYYRWIEPRFKPQLFDDMTRDYSGTHPAKRFASESESDSSDDEELLRIMNIMLVAKRMVASGDIQATRFVMSEDVMPLIEATLSEKPDIELMVNYIGKDSVTDEDMYSVWLFSKSIDAVKVEMVEKSFAEGTEIDPEVLENIFSLKAKREKTIKKIIKTVKNICNEYGIEDVYLVGGYARAVAMNDSLHTVEDLDFSGAWANQSIKVGGLLAERLGVKNAKLYHRTMTLSFVYKDVKIDFKGNFSPLEIRQKMREEDIETTPLNMDIYNRDFTINMMVHDINKDEVFDITGESMRDLRDRKIRTYFDPDYICRQNPLIILRALKFKTRGYDIDPELEKAMICNASLLFDGRYPEERLIMARESIEAGDKGLAYELFKEYGLEKIKEM